MPVDRFTHSKRLLQNFKLKVMINSGVLSCGKESNDVP